MKRAKTITKCTFWVLLIFSIVIFSGVIYLDTTIDNEYNIENGEDLNINSVVPITAEIPGEKFSSANSRYAVGKEFDVSLKAFAL